MILPLPTKQYDTNSEGTRNALLENADRLNYKRNQDVEIVGNSLILHSPDGARWRVEVDNTGVLSATAI